MKAFESIIDPSQLDLVLFVADKIEWDQAGTPPYLPSLLRGLDQSLEHAAFCYLSYLWEQRDKLRVLHPWLAAAYQWLSSRLQARKGGKRVLGENKVID